MVLTIKELDCAFDGKQPKLSTTTVLVNVSPRIKGRREKRNIGVSQAIAKMTFLPFS